jgi:rod shape-determining protein MreD
MGIERKIALVTAIICGVLQVMLAPYISIGGVCPNFMILATVCAAFTVGPSRTCVYGFACGVVFDLSTTGPLGAMALVLTVVGYLVSVLAHDALDESVPVALGVLLVSAFIAELIELVVMCFMGSATFFHSFVATVLPGTLYDAVFGIICFPIVRSRLSRMGRGMNIARRSTMGMHVKNINLR